MKLSHLIFSGTDTFPPGELGAVRITHASSPPGSLLVRVLIFACTPPAQGPRPRPSLVWSFVVVSVAVARLRLHFLPARSSAQNAMCVCVCTPFISRRVVVIAAG